MFTIQKLDGSVDRMNLLIGSSLQMSPQIIHSVYSDSGQMELVLYQMSSMLGKVLVLSSQLELLVLLYRTSTALRENSQSLVLQKRDLLRIHQTNKFYSILLEKQTLFSDSQNLDSEHSLSAVMYMLHSLQIMFKVYPYSSLVLEKIRSLQTSVVLVPSSPADYLENLLQR